MGNPLNFQSFNCASLDSDGVSDIVKMMRANPIAADHRVFLFDEAHALSPKSFDILLTALEEPRANVFIFATTEGERIPKQVRDRCSVHELSMIDAPSAIRHLWSVCQAERIEAEPEALDLIAALAQGSARAMIEMLEAAVISDRVTADFARRRFKLDYSETVATILVLTLRGELGEAISKLNNWAEMPGRKRKLLHDCLVDIYCDVIGARR
jgi:DNA polymerase-3 subunit gamma/tau